MSMLRRVGVGRFTGDTVSATCVTWTAEGVPSGFLWLCAARLSGASNSHSFALTGSAPPLIANSRHIYGCLEVEVIFVTADYA
jgi:hypothetical protein